MPAPTDFGVEIGQVLDGKYRVDAILGHGGMGVVVASTHLGLENRYAIKLLRKDVVWDPDVVARFVREAKAAGRLRSEYVAKVHDVHMPESLDKELPYMVMEYLEGRDIGQLLEDRTTLAIPFATELALQAAEALAEAHSLGIVHRDIKPTNLFVTWRGDGRAVVKVLDFGISKSPLGTDLKLTQTQSVLGTPAYMSPEQMRSAHMVDSRSDIWSLGCVLYEMIEGVRPFEAESFSEMCVMVAVDPPRPMVKAPPQLAAIIGRCLAKQPELRYSTMADFARELIGFATSPHEAAQLVERMMQLLRNSPLGWEGENSTGSLPAISRSQIPTPLVTDRIDRAAQPPRRRWPIALAVFVFGATAAALIVMLASPSDRAGPLPTSFLEHATWSPPPPRVVVTKPVIVDPPQPPPIVDPKPTKLIKKPPIKSVEIKVPTATPDGSAVPQNCDGFGPMHGCPK
ncbi:MAG TPA: serine/threonine-protein kinase [Kofleriaceae bacterium]|nr:serine/threonine-protein kinase [Kofleriaceae bacterium]